MGNDYPVAERHPRLTISHSAKNRVGLFLLVSVVTFPHEHDYYHILAKTARGSAARVEEGRWHFARVDQAQYRRIEEAPPRME